MIKRIVTGIVLGAVVGMACAAALVLGLGLTSFDGAYGASMAYLAAAGTGALTGLIAGKPIWSRDGKIEAGLKAVFGAGMAAGAMFALRRWIHVEVDLSSLKAGSGAVSELPATSLPAIAAGLGLLFELDNTDGGPDRRGGESAAARPVPSAGVRVRGSNAGPVGPARDEADDGDGEARKARR